MLCKLKAEALVGEVVVKFVVKAEVLKAEILEVAKVEVLKVEVQLKPKASKNQKDTIAKIPRTGGAYLVENKPLVGKVTEISVSFK